MKQGEKVKIVEKVVFKDRVVEKAIYHIKTIKSKNKTIVDQTIELSGETQAISQQVLSHEETKVQITPVVIRTDRHTTVGMSIQYGKDIHAVKTYYPHLTLPLVGNFSLFIETNLKLKDTKVGLDFML